MTLSRPEGRKIVAAQMAIRLPLRATSRMTVGGKACGAYLVVTRAIDHHSFMNE
jgi:hypothetical protein